MGTWVIVRGGNWEDRTNRIESQRARHIRFRHDFTSTARRSNSTTASRLRGKGTGGQKVLLMRKRIKYIVEKDMGLLGQSSFLIQEMVIYPGAGSE